VFWLGVIFLYEFLFQPFSWNCLTLGIETGDRYKRNGPFRQLPIFRNFARRFPLFSRENPKEAQPRALGRVTIDKSRRWAPGSNLATRLSFWCQVLAQRLSWNSTFAAPQLIDSNAGGYLADRKVDVGDAQYGRVAPRYREEVVLIEKEATSQKQARFEQDLTEGTERKPQFGAETTQRRLLLFSPERQTIAGVSGEFESQLAS
jgi:hypothetical protein